MVRVRIRFPGFCLSRVSARVRVRAHPQQYKQSYNAMYKDDPSGSSNNSIEMNFNDDMLKPESEIEGGNRVMVVVDSSHEAENALQWALSHTVQTQDTIALLLVAKQGTYSDGKKAYELLGSLKEMCQMSRPGVHVETTVVQGKEKGPTVVEEAKKQRVSLLVLGQRKRTLFRRLRSMGMRKKIGNRIVEYCIQNANCMAIAVRRKSRKYGGYLITTKRHKNFWLLA